MDEELPDDFFVEDLDLDELHLDALGAIEQTALQSTQANIPRSLPSNNGGVQPPSSDYGLEDEDVIDLDAQQPYLPQSLPHKAADKVTQHESWRQHRYGQPIKPIYEGHGHVNAQATANKPNGLGLQHALTNTSPKAPEEGTSQVETLNVRVLQQRIAELEAECTHLHKITEEAKSAAYAKAGEISIVRANQEKATREYERRLAALQQQHAQEIGNQKAELEATRKDREKIETNNKFLQHDLAQEAERAKNVKRALKDAHGNVGCVRLPAQPSPLSTPKKDRHLPFRDGFDDDEVVLVSPSKTKPSPKPSTPRVGSKRKRGPTTEPSPSPGQPLALSESDWPSEPPPVTHGKTPSLTIPTEASDAKFELLQRILNHRGRSSARVFDDLSKCAFPSKPSFSLASALYDKFSIMSPKQDVEDFRRSVCGTLITLWSACLSEKYYHPLYALNELLHHILLVSPSTLSITLTSSIAPLCLATADLVAVPTAKACKGTSSDPDVSVEFRQHIDPLDYLNMLHLLTTNCYPNHKESLVTFWTHMEFDFVLLLLHKSQPLSCIRSMLQLLRTSVLVDTFAAITDRSPAQQAKHESDIIDRLTILLFEVPVKPQRQTQSTHTPLDLANQRLDIVSLLYTLAETPHGGRLLATHRLFIGRLVRFLHDSILGMYAYIEPTHAHTTACVNTAVHLLSHLTTAHANLVDVRARLAAVPGGAQKHLVALSRVAFAEGFSSLESGIEPEAAEAAHRMLDEMLSPEEGEAVVEVFASGR